MDTVTITAVCQLGAISGPIKQKITAHGSVYKNDYFGAAGLSFTWRYALYYCCLIMLAKMMLPKSSYWNRCLMGDSSFDFTSMLVDNGAKVEFLISILYLPGASLVCLRGGDTPIDLPLMKTSPQG